MHASECAQRLQNFELVEELIEQIPLGSVAKTVRMENLLVQREWSKVVELFGEEDLAAWPFWQIGAGAFARAKAHNALKNGAEAEADLQLALQYTSDSRIRMSILRTIAFNREQVLQDESAALENVPPDHRFEDKHRQVPTTTTQIQGAARLYRARGEYDDALSILRRVDIDSLQGTWRGSMLLSLGETLSAAGHVDQARAAFEKVINGKQTLASHRKAAQEAIGRLK